MTVSKQVTDLTADHQRLIREGGDLAVEFSQMLSYYCVNLKEDPEFIAMNDPRDLFSNCLLHTHNSTPPCNDPSTVQMKRLLLAR